MESIERQNASLSIRGTLKYLHMDLNDLFSVRAAATAFAEAETRLDVLWNNAGIGGEAVPAGGRTAQGIEAYMGIHCVAHLLLAELLLPLLRTAATQVSHTAPGSVRVVWSDSVLTDVASPIGGVDFAACEGTQDRNLAYIHSKAGVRFLAREFAKRYGPDGIVSVPQNPGNLATGIFRGFPWWKLIFINRTLHSQAMAPYTPLFAGLSSEITLENNGILVIPWGRLRGSSESPRNDIELAMLPEDEGGTGASRRFWDWCEQKIQDALPSA
jgi:NAD(P)-dependent dehydrogenase (short-subunit alcohol dehydrogenase family)